MMADTMQQAAERQRILALAEQHRQLAITHLLHGRHSMAEDHIGRHRALMQLHHEAKAEMRG
jgi:hypothetical protein